ncbi:MAG: PAS domain S-box protein [Hyphomicrobiales bacterium]|nr:PAS domain S-box protein [Hyphomicrobiales bacterium]MCP5372400.1 PAS domain S-box protein [Hyphomicrobiales bacterium]
MHIRVGGTVTLVAMVTALGFLLIALAYVMVERRVDAAFERMDRAFSVAAEVQSTRVAVLSARQYEQTYWDFPKEADRAYQQNLVHAAIDNLDQVEAEASHPDLAPAIRQVKSDLQRYGELFAAESQDGRVGSPRLNAAFFTAQSLLDDLTARLSGDVFRAQRDLSRIRATADRAMVTALLAATVLATLVAFLIGRRLATRITRMTGAVTAISQGELALDVPFTDRGDEVGDISRALEALRDIARAGSDWFWEVDRDLRISRVSRRMEEATGIAAGDLLGRRIDEVTSSPLPLDALLDPAGDHAPFRDVELALERDGEVQFVRVSGSPIFAADGAFAGYRGSGTDITAEVTAKREAAAAETRLFDALASIREGFVLTDADDRIVYVNGRVDEIFGPGADGRSLFRPGEPLEDVLADLARRATYAAVDADPVDAARWRLDLHRRAPCEVEFLHEGGDRWLRATERRTTEGGWVITWTDITALKDREEALRQSEERFRLATTGADAGIWDYDADRRLVYASPHLKEMIGLPPTEEPLTVDEWRPHIHPDDLAAHDDALRAHLRGETPYFHIEHRLRGAGGAYRWISTRGLGLRGGDGRVYRIAGSITDITERRRAEAEKETLERQLRQAQKMEAIGTLAGGIAHDFNNILGAILGFSDLARGSLPADSPALAHLDRVREAGTRAVALVDQMLAFGRHGGSEKRAVDLNLVVNEAMHLIRASTPASVEIRKAIAAAGVEALADPTQIHQVVVNLCTNAAHAMPGGGVMDVGLDLVDLAQEDDDAGANGGPPPGRYFLLTVADTGTGMDRTTLNQAFDPFFTTKEVGKGTGLGLSVVHGIVSGHGGTVEVDSEPGRGTTFRVYLPCIPAPGAAPAAAAPAPARQGRGEMVLFIDDEEPLVSLARQVLPELGYRCMVFEDPAAALRALRAAPERFDVVITDQTMPAMGGAEVARAVARTRADLPVVLATGHGLETLAKTVDLSVFRDHLKKPLTKDALGRCLARVLDGGGS